MSTFEDRLSQRGRVEKAVLIGLDSMTLDLLQRFGREGRLPNLQRLMERGVTTEAFSSPPPGTATNWPTIATGAHAGTHGVVAMSLHKPGGPLDKIESGFFSHHCRAERIWQAAERAGKRPLVLKYPTSWPPTVEKGIQVEGFADPDWNVLAIAPRCAYSTRKMYGLPEGSHTVTAAPQRTMPMGFQVELRSASGWQNVPESLLDPLEATLPLTPTQAEPETLYALITSSQGEGYDRVIVAPSKNTQEALASLEVGQWSSWIRRQFQIGSKGQQGRFRYKLVALSSDAKDFLLFQSQIFPDLGWTVPESLADELVEKVGPFQELGGMNFPLWWRWITPQEAEELFLEEMEYQIHWLSEAARYLMANEKWDLLFTQWHGIDHMDHAFLSCLDPGHEWHDLGTRVIQKTYELADRYVGEILGQIDEDTLVVVTSDHGHAARVGSWLDVNALLEQHGLLVYKELDAGIRLEDGGYGPPMMREIDWSRTKAAVMHSGFVYVNLKGREPHGIVEPGQEYEEVVEQVIDILEDARSPSFPDKRYAEVVLRKEDAEVLGLYGDLVGDVVFFAKVRFRGSHHGNFHSSRAKIGSLRAVTLFKGPGIQQGMLRQQAIHLVDIAPTMAVLLDIPTPRQSEGKILWDIME